MFECGLFFCTPGLPCPFCLSFLQQAGFTYMKKNDTDIPDIYRPEVLKPEPAPVQVITELIDHEIHKQRIFNISVGLLTLAMATSLTIYIMMDYLSVSRQATPSREKTTRLASFILPEDEQWTLEYQQVALQAESSEPSGRKAFSTKWVKNAAYHIIMGEQALRRNELSAAQNHFEAALMTFPAMIGTRSRLGEVYLKRQYFEKAVEQLQKALEEQPSVDVLNNLGVTYMGLKDYVLAESHLQQALRQQPDLAGCYKNIALLYQKTSRTNEAVAAFNKYFALDPQDTTLIRNYVAYLNASGQIRAAIDFLERIKGADSQAILLLLAKTAAQDNDAERAVRALRAASHFITPRQMTAEMHAAVFDKIARNESFEALLYRLELAAVSLSTNLDTKGASEY